MNVKALASFSAALSIFYGGVVARTPGAEPKPLPSMAFSTSPSEPRPPFYPRSLSLAGSNPRNWD